MSGALWPIKEHQLRPVTGKEGFLRPKLSHPLTLPIIIAVSSRWTECSLHMELFLIRHGETVDNVAGLYAGVRDSALTNHGVEQARRLGEHFAKEDVHVAFTHIFASPLSRAYKTAQAIQTAQAKLKTKDLGQVEENTRKVEIVRVSELIEQDFGLVHRADRPRCCNAAC